jgi:hypothetical protein
VDLVSKEENSRYDGEIETIEEGCGVNKIRNFKISLNTRDILRLLKNTSKISEITPQLEQAAERESERLKKKLNLAAIYETVQKDKLPEELAEGGPEDWVAATLYLATLGSEVESEIEEAQNKNESILSQMLHSISMEALDQATNFIKRLISEEAKKDDYEISKPRVLKELENEKYFKSFFSIIPAEKINVSLSGTNTLTPLYSSWGIIYWTPVKKRVKK